MKTLLISLALGLCCACSHDESTSKANNGVHAAGSPTAMDQGNNEADLNLVQSVRKALVNDSALSTAAKNVTAVARDGTVTLKGTLASQTEKDQVGTCVSNVSGVRRVENEITVKPN